MGIGETLRRHPGAFKAAASLLILICAGVIYVEYKSQNPSVSSSAGKVFYSDDDGKTWFSDDPLKGSPYDHNGKQAHRALVYRCSSGQPFVAFLAKYSDAQIAQSQAELAHAPPGTPSRLFGSPPQDLRKPGQSAWVTNKTPSMGGHPEVACPDGHGTAEFLSPMDADSGTAN